MGLEDRLLPSGDVPREADPGLEALVRFPDRFVDSRHRAPGDVVAEARVDGQGLADLPVILEVPGEQPVVEALVAVLGEGHVGLVVERIVSHAAGQGHVPVPAAALGLEARLEVVGAGQVVDGLGEGRPQRVLVVRLVGPPVAGVGAVDEVPEPRDVVVLMGRIAGPAAPVAADLELEGGIRRERVEIRNVEQIGLPLVVPVAVGRDQRVHLGPEGRVGMGLEGGLDAVLLGRLVGQFEEKFR